MIEQSNYAEEVKERLLQELVSMKKQSVFSLIFAIICVIVMVFLLFKLRESNRNLNRAREKVAQQNDSLEARNVAITNLKNELDAWRMSLLEVDSIPASVANPAPIIVPEEVALANGPEPIIERPTLPPTIRRYSANRVPAGSDNPMAQNETGAASVQMPEETRVIYQPPIQQYSLKKEESISNTPFFGYIIYIQDAKKREASTDLQEMLKAQGAIVPAIQSRNLPARFGTSIKYFHQQDEKNAQGVKNLLLGILRKNKIDATEKDIPVTYVFNAKVSLGQLEVWVGN